MNADESSGFAGAGITFAARPQRASHSRGTPSVLRQLLVLLNGRQDCKTSSHNNIYRFSKSKCGFLRTSTVTSMDKRPINQSVAAAAALPVKESREFISIMRCRRWQTICHCLLKKTAMFTKANPTRCLRCAIYFAFKVFKIYRL